MKDIIESILLVDDEDLFHLVFEDACSLLDITLTLESINSADDAENLFKTKYKFNEINRFRKFIYQITSDTSKSNS